MSDIKTWTPKINWIGHDNGTVTMVPAQGGMWVSVSDYRAALDATEVKLNETLLSLGSRNKEISMLKAALNNRNMEIRRLKK